MSSVNSYCGNIYSSANPNTIKSSSNLTSDTLLLIFKIYIPDWYNNKSASKCRKLALVCTEWNDLTYKFKINYINSKFPRLEDIVGTNIEYVLTFLNNHRDTLKALNLYTFVYWRNALISVLNKIQNIESLSLTYIDDQDLMKLEGEFSKVSYLNLSNGSITDKGFLLLIKFFPKVTRLILEANKINGSSLTKDVRIFSQLTYLSLNDNKITWDGLNQILKFCPYLIELRIMHGNYFTSISEEQKDIFHIYLKNVMKDHPNLKIF